MSDVKFNIRPFLRFKREITEALREGASNGPIADALKQWGFIYRSFIQRRFDSYSKGSGDWAPLAISTKLGRAGAGVRRVKALYSAGHIDEAQYNERKARAVKEYKKKAAGIREGKDKTSILRDTNTLFNALSPSISNIPGQFQQTIPGGVRVGFGGPGRYPAGGPTIADIARFHQTGGPKLPKREIIVPPPHNVVMRMAEVMNKAIQRVLKDTGNGS